MQKSIKESFQLFGIIACQWSKLEVTSFVGLVFFQKAKQTWQFAGVALFVWAGEKDESTFASVNFSKVIAKES